MSIIKFYSFSKETEVFAPHPTPASKQIPEWYKKQDAYFQDETELLRKGFSASTIKKCMPLFDGISAGYIIYMPCDVFIDTTNPEKIEWSIPATLNFIKKDLVSFHSEEQTSGYPKDASRYHKDIFRIMPFWAVGTEDGYSSLFIHPIHRDPLPFKMFDAIVDTDKFISDGHLSMLIQKDFKGVIEKGTPLIQVIPFKRDSFEMELVYGKDSESVFKNQRFFIRSKFKHAYKNFLRSKKEYK